MKKGITITTLSVAVAVMLIISTTVSVVGVRIINTANYEDYKSKVKRMADVVLEYINTNKTLPTTGEVISTDSLSNDFRNELTNNGDLDTNLYVIDVNLLDIVTNIGKGTIQDEDVFVVSPKTNNVYYLRGRLYRGTTYYGY